MSPRALTASWWHRMDHQVLMVGCGWSTDRPRELIALMGGAAALGTLLRSE